MPILPAANSSPILKSSATAIGERDKALCALFSPASIRLAIETSCSRFSSGTVPISRRYNLTGSEPLSNSPAERSSSESSLSCSTDEATLSSKRASASSAGDSSFSITSLKSSGKMDSLSRSSPIFSKSGAPKLTKPIPPCSFSILIKSVPPFLVLPSLDSKCSSHDTSDLLIGSIP